MAGRAEGGLYESCLSEGLSIQNMSANLNMPGIGRNTTILRSAAMSLMNLQEGQIIYHKSGIRGEIVAIHEYSAEDILISIKFDESLPGSSDLCRFRPSSIGIHLFHSFEGTSKAGAAGIIPGTQKVPSDIIESMVKQGLEPVISCDSKTLILGTLPGDKSIEEKEYYANKSNQFWKVIYGIFGDSSIPQNYDEKISYLKARNIALWDVLLSGVREGSSDKKIRNPVANDFNSIFTRYGSIETVVFNGSNAAAYYTKLVSSSLLDKGKSCITLPSTSGSNTRMTIEEKIQRWRTIKE